MISSRAGNILTLEAIGSIRCSPEMPLWWVLHRYRGRARWVVPAAWMERHGVDGTGRRGDPGTRQRRSRERRPPAMASTFPSLAPLATAAAIQDGIRSASSGAPRSAWSRRQRPTVAAARAGGCPRAKSWSLKSRTGEPASARIHWVEDLGEAATVRGKWRGGRGGDGDREVATRGRRRRPEGGGDEGEVAEEKASPKFGGGDGVPGLWRMRSRLPLRMVFGEKIGTVAVQGGLGPPLQMV